jgi:excinuclease ABC subunit C
MVDLQAGPAGDEACEQFLLTRYARDCPEELIVNCLNRVQHVARVLSDANGHPVRVTVPQQGVKRDLLELCRRNYAYRVSIATSR